MSRESVIIETINQCLKYFIWLTDCMNSETYFIECDASYDETCYEMKFIDLHRRTSEKYFLFHAIYLLYGKLHRVIFYCIDDKWYKLHFIPKKSPVTRYRCPTFQNIVSKIKKKRLISSLDMNRIIFVIDIWLFINIVVHNCEIYTNLETFCRFLFSIVYISSFTD